jgi:DNA-binding LacI/PurR family transcriptional regulator
MAGRRVTSADVAALAGVSRSTVSYVLGGGARLDSFSPETVARVHAAATKLAYTPNAAARSLRKGQSGVVLLALPDLPLAGNLGKFVAGLTDAVSATGRSLVTWYVRPGVRLRDLLRDIHPQAILEFTPLTGQDRETAAGSDIPVISTTDPIADLDRTVGELQVRHMARAGHRRLGIVTTDDEWVGVFSGARRRGAREAAAALGLSLPLEVSIGTHEMAAATRTPLPRQFTHSARKGTVRKRVPGSAPARGGPAGDTAIVHVATVLREWTSGPEPVTGVCCFNDLFAGLTIAAARSAGLQVPGDLSVMGVDDEPLGAFLEPLLTTVRFDFAPMVGYAAGRLREVLDQQPPPPQVSSEIIELVDRDSVTPPPRKPSPRTGS